MRGEAQRVRGQVDRQPGGAARGRARDRRVQPGRERRRPARWRPGRGGGTGAGSSATTVGESAWRRRTSSRRGAARFATAARSGCAGPDALAVDARRHRGDACSSASVAGELADLWRRAGRRRAPARAAALRGGRVEVGDAQAQERPRRPPGRAGPRRWRRVQSRPASGRPPGRRAGCPASCRRRGGAGGGGGAGRAGSRGSAGSPPRLVVSIREPVDPVVGERPLQRAAGGRGDGARAARSRPVGCSRRAT